MEQDDERLHALRLAQMLDERVHGRDLRPELEPLDRARRHDRRGSLERQPDEADLRVVDLANLVRRQDRLIRAAVEDVRREVLEERAAERGAVLTPVDGMAAGAAELVAVAHP